MLQQYSYHLGARIQRIDHLNCFTPDVQASYDFYRELGFRLTEFTETDDAESKLWAVWMHRKGNVHDLAFTNGFGPRLHHIGLWNANVLDIIHICDVMATSGYLSNMERGPGRHGISNAFFLYIRDPDGHRIELFSSDYLTVDPDHAPIRWSLKLRISSHASSRVSRVRPPTTTVRATDASTERDAPPDAPPATGDDRDAVPEIGGHAHHHACALRPQGHPEHRTVGDRSQPAHETSAA